MSKYYNYKRKSSKDLSWRVFDNDSLVIRPTQNIYKNRYRIKDSFGYLDKLNFEYKIIINSNNDCPFLFGDLIQIIKLLNYQIIK